MKTKQISISVPKRLAETRGILGIPEMMGEDFLVVSPPNSYELQVFRINVRVDTECLGGSGEPVRSQLIEDEELRALILAEYERQLERNREERRTSRAQKAQVAAFLKRADSMVRGLSGGPGPYGGSPPCFSLPSGETRFLEIRLTGSFEGETVGGFQLYRAGNSAVQGVGWFTVAVNFPAKIVLWVAADVQ